MATGRSHGTIRSGCDSMQSQSPDASHHIGGGSGVGECEGSVVVAGCRWGSGVRGSEKESSSLPTV